MDTPSTEHAEQEVSANEPGPHQSGLGFGRKSQLAVLVVAWAVMALFVGPMLATIAVVLLPLFYL